jgi:hypothetical protein
MAAYCKADIHGFAGNSILNKIKKGFRKRKLSKSLLQHMENA